MTGELPHGDKYLKWFGTRITKTWLMWQTEQNMINEDTVYCL